MGDEYDMTTSLPPDNGDTTSLLDESMRVALSVDYLARCKQAVLDAQAVYLASVAVPQVEPNAPSIAGYLNDLAKAAGVSIDAVLRWACLKLDAKADGAFAAAWGHLARQLGVPEDGALNQFRLTFLAEVGADFEAEILNYYAEEGGKMDPFTVYECSIKGGVDRLEPTARGRLAAFEDELRNGYRQRSRPEGRK